MNLFDVIEELVEEQGLDRSVITEIVIEGILDAYSKKYPDLSLKAELDKKTGNLALFVEKEVVQSVEDEDKEISLKKAKNLDTSLEIGHRVWMPFEGKIGRIEILRARQIIAQRIRKVEASAVYESFKDRQGELVQGVIHKCERNGTVVKIGDHLAFLPKSLTSPADKCTIGFTIRALLKEVLPEPRNDNQLILDRVSELFLQRLFEIEIPEVFERLVEIKKIARVPGYKSKVIVVSHDPNIDPVGTCIGVGGSRIKPILKELGNEKIDVISWSDNPEILIKNALKPAQVDRIEISNSSVLVWLPEDQRSLAIGKMGQNIGLASRLTGYEIRLESESPSVKKVQEPDLFGEAEDIEGQEPL